MKIEWEYDLAERPFCEQLQGMGWEWLQGDTDVPELTERENFREVLLKGRLVAALRKLNLRDGQLYTRRHGPRPRFAFVRPALWRRRRSARSLVWPT